MSNSNHSNCPNWETCEYGEILWWNSNTPNKACCYCIKTNELRGCAVESCDKYKPRKYPRGTKV